MGNRDLQRDEYESLPNEMYTLNCSGLSTLEQTALGLWMEAVWNENHKDGIPFGINYSNAKFFDEVGRLTNSAPGVGLTCATFVIAVFHDNDLPLIEIESWPSSQARPEDKKWQEAALRNAQKYDEAPEAHISAQEEYVGVSPRFRPEEVAASGAMLEETPITFTNANTWAIELLTNIEKAGTFR